MNILLKWRRPMLAIIAVAAIGLFLGASSNSVLAQTPDTDPDAEAQHCCYPPRPPYYPPPVYHTATPTPTPTNTPTAVPPTNTPTPTPPPACQVIDIFFGQNSYIVGETINVTTRLADSVGTPLGGAQVTAVVDSPQAAAQANTGFGFVDRIGEYDGEYNGASAPGIYTFNITASDPTGQSFSPCIGQAQVTVEEDEPDVILLEEITISGPAEGVVNTDYTFVATIVPANATQPISYTWSPEPVSGQGSNSATYNFDSAGNKTISVTAANSGSTVTDVRSFVVTDNGSEIIALESVTIDGPSEGETNTDYTFTAAIVPANATPPISYTWSPEPVSGQGTSSATYNFDTPGSKSIAVTAVNPGGAVTAVKTFTVTETSREPTITFDPLNPSLTLGAVGSNSVVVQNINGLLAIQVEVDYNPALVNVVDARPNDPGIQVRPLGIFGGPNAVVARNEVNESSGRIFFDAALLAPTLVSDTQVFEIDWQAVGEGNGNLTLENVLLLGPDSTTEINATVINGSVQVSSSSSSVTGQVTLQGRTNYSGVVITSDSGETTKTDPAGNFVLTGGNNITVQHPGYLSSQSSLEAAIQSGGSIQLLAGDANNDDAIDIFDLAFLAQNYEGDNEQADLNGDGEINIMDLVLAAANYGLTGPLSR